MSYNHGYEENVCPNDNFTKFLDKFIREGKLLETDFQEFENELLQDPKQNDVIPGMGGLRKARLKSFGKGKRGGFRVDYLDFSEVGIIYLVVIYPKNVKEDLSSSEKQIILKMIEEIKKGLKNG